MINEFVIKILLQNVDFYIHQNNIYSKLMKSIHAAIDIGLMKYLRFYFRMFTKVITQVYETKKKR